MNAALNDPSVEKPTLFSIFKGFLADPDEVTAGPEVPQQQVTQQKKSNSWGFFNDILANPAAEPARPATASRVEQSQSKKPASVKTILGGLLADSEATEKDAPGYSFSNFLNSWSTIPESQWVFSAFQDLLASTDDTKKENPTRVSNSKQSTRSESLTDFGSFFGGLMADKEAFKSDQELKKGSSFFEQFKTNDGIENYWKVFTGLLAQSEDEPTLEPVKEDPVDVSKETPEVPATAEKTVKNSISVEIKKLDAEELLEAFKLFLIERHGLKTAKTEPAAVVKPVKEVLLNDEPQKPFDLLSTFQDFLATSEGSQKAEKHRQSLIDNPYDFLKSLLADAELEKAQTGKVSEPIAVEAESKAPFNLNLSFINGFLAEDDKESKPVVQNKVAPTAQKPEEQKFDFIEALKSVLADPENENKKTLLAEKLQRNNQNAWQNPSVDKKQKSADADFSFDNFFSNGFKSENALSFFKNLLADPSKDEGFELNSKGKAQQTSFFEEPVAKKRVVTTDDSEEKPLKTRAHGKTLGHFLRNLLADPEQENETQSFFNPGSKNCRQSSSGFSSKQSDIDWKNLLSGLLASPDESFETKVRKPTSEDTFQGFFSNFYKGQTKGFDFSSLLADPDAFSNKNASPEIAGLKSLFSGLFAAETFQEATKSFRSALADQGDDQSYDNVKSFFQSWSKSSSDSTSHISSFLKSILADNEARC